MIIVYDRFGRRIATYDSTRDLHEDYPDAEVVRGKVVIKEP